MSNVETETPPIRVLAADDDAGIIKIYRSLFESSGSSQGSSIDQILNRNGNTTSPTKPKFELITVSQGLDAVNAVRQGLRESRPFDCVLMDVRMPPGIDGVEASQQIRHLAPELQIIIVTAYADRLMEDINQVVGGKVTLVRKPFFSTKLVKMVTDTTHDR